MNDRKTIRKWIWVWDFEKEEQWLNAMALEGWVLDGVGWCTYHFRRCEPGEYAIRLEMHPHDEAYWSFMAETGAEYVGYVVGWQYFRKKTELGPFDIFSDIDSRVRHLDRICKVLLCIGMANLAIGLVNSVSPYVRTGWINLLCATVLMYALGRIHGKKEALEKDRLVRE